MWTRFGNSCFQTNLRNKFFKKIDHKKLINNRKLMLLAFDKEFCNFFKIKCQSAFELTFWLTFSHCLRKNWSRFFQSNCCIKFMPFGKFFIFMPFGNYAIWDVIELLLKSETLLLLAPIGWGQSGQLAWPFNTKSS